MEHKTCPPYPVSIYVAGDLSDARRICREHTFAVGLCVTVTPTEFIYTGGAETGVCVGLINYPRFPSNAESLWATACGLGDALMRGLCQQSYLVQSSDRCEWFSRRDALATKEQP